ncbi:MAG: DUF6134 family protein [Gammaproteobacteria bacterium]
MMPVSRSLHARITAALLCSALLLLPVIAGASTATEWRFRVYLDDREIGHHDFFLTENGPDTDLRSRAHFDVTFLKIPLFKYRHENTEVWQSHCLQRITSTTDENGKHFRVTGSTAGKVFELTTHAGAITLPACISTFAYWDKSFLERDRLLNSQTGEYLDVEVRYLGEDSIRARNEDTRAQRYLLTAGKASIELWYSQDGRWLGLQSTTDSGRLLRYALD